MKDEKEYTYKGWTLAAVNKSWPRMRWYNLFPPDAPDGTRSVKQASTLKEAKEWINQTEEQRKENTQ